MEYYSTMVEEVIFPFGFEHIMLSEVKPERERQLWYGIIICRI